MSRILNMTCENCTYYNNCKKDGVNGPCDDWHMSFEYYTEICSQAPWYIIDAYNESRCSWGEVLEKLEKESCGEPININLYDAIEKIYGLNEIALSEVLGVSISIVGYAKSRYTPEKRMDHFSTTLKIPVDFFYKFTNKDLPTLESCFEEFKKVIA